MTSFVGTPVSQSERSPTSCTSRCWKPGVCVGLGRLVRDVELVVDVTEDGEPRLREQLDRLVRFRLRHRHVAEKLAGHGIGDERPLVADERLRDARREDVRPRRPEHPSGRDDHRNAGGPGARDRRVRAGAQLNVLRDQRPVEVARERLDLAGEVRREDQLPAAEET